MYRKRNVTQHPAVSHSSHPYNSLTVSKTLTLIYPITSVEGLYQACRPANSSHVTHYRVDIITLSPLFIVRTCNKLVPGC